MEHSRAIADTRRWILAIVVGLNLCPFARRVFDEDKIRYVVSDTTDRAGLLAALETELLALAGVPIETVETTLLIHPDAMTDFHDYNDFLGDADLLIEQLGLEGVIQIASFHPEYQFADVRPDAVENYTNRSPFPMLHLLREASIAKVAGSAEAMADIPRRNIETLNALGRESLMRLLKPAE